MVYLFFILSSIFHSERDTHRWEYAMEHDVQLPDEYDQIFRDLEPFWGMEPSDLFSTQAELEAKTDSYTIGKATKNASVGILAYAFQDGRYDQLIAGSREILGFLKKIEHLLPEFRLTISPHDNPNRLSDWGVKQTLMEAAAAKTRGPSISNHILYP